eukprot:5121825-Lingulodinium_polyedra.AAC.1
MLSTLRASSANGGLSNYSRWAELRAWPRNFCNPTASGERGGVRLRSRRVGCRTVTPRNAR